MIEQPPSAWDVVNRLYGDEKNINKTEFEKNFGKYFDPYDSTPEEFSKKAYGEQVGSLLSGYGQTLDQLSSKQTFAGGGSIEKMQAGVYEDTLSKLNSARSSYNESIFGHREKYEQGLIDTASSLADSITGFSFSAGEDGRAEAKSRVDASLTGGRRPSESEYERMIEEEMASGG